MRVPTGIPGFDELCEGGFVKDSLNLLTGGPGCGKTIFCLQFIYNGVKQFNEPGIYISLEESKKQLIEEASKFNWDFQELENHGKAKIVSYDVFEIGSVLDAIKEDVKKMNAKRVVIDSTSVYGMSLETEFEVRKALIELSKTLKELDCTTIITSEVVEGKEGTMSRFGVEEFIADSILLVTFESLGGEYSRNLLIRKMRSTKNDEDIHPLEICDKGIVVHKLE